MHSSTICMNAFLLIAGRTCSINENTFFTSFFLKEEKRLIQWESMYCSYNKFCCVVFLKIPVRARGERFSIVSCVRYYKAISKTPLLITSWELVCRSNTWQEICVRACVCVGVEITKCDEEMKDERLHVFTCRTDFCVWRPSRWRTDNRYLTDESAVPLA